MLAALKSRTDTAAGALTLRTTSGGLTLAG